MIKVNEHIYLSHPEKADAPDIVEWMQDESIYRNLLQIPTPYTLTDALSWLERNAAFEAQHGFNRNYSIRNAEGKLIGGIGLHFNHGIDAPRTEFGYWLGQPYRGQGIMTEVIHAFCAFAKARHGIHELEADVFTFNEASQKLLLKCGFTATGIQVTRTKVDGTQVQATGFVKQL